MSNQADLPVRVHVMPFGPLVRSGGGAGFRLWAPAQMRIPLVLEGHAATIHRMPLEQRWHELITDQAGLDSSRVRWRPGNNSRLGVIADLSEHDFKAGGPTVDRVLRREGTSAHPGRLGPCSVAWSIEKAASKTTPKANSS